MTQTVGNVCDEIKIFTLLATKETIHGINHDLDYVNIIPLVKTTNVVGLSNSAFVENEVNSTSMILNEQPVVHVLALAIDRKWFAVTDIVDKERNQFLRELIKLITCL